jgi:TatD DNase family protein
MLIDTHCHLWFEHFDQDRKQCLDRAASAGVTGFLQVGTDLETNERALALARCVDNMKATVGVHPHDAKSLDDAAVARLAEQAADSEVVALGEMGLDYFRNHSPQDVQREAFRIQLRMATDLDLPVVLHCRDAHADLLKIINEEGIPRKGVAHCYSGDMEWLEQYLATGLYISIAGPVTYKKSDGLRAAAKACPADRLMVETDCPYLTPEPNRGKRNEPAYVRYTAEAVAKARGVSLEELAELTTRNAETLFGPLRGN